jgi:predicted transposase/invertase (TIGR01784 family)
MLKRRLVSFDWAMKKLLRSKASFEILEGFLSELLRDDIRILEILESESNKEGRLDKFNRVEREMDYLQRILFSTAKTITEHFQEGDPYAEIVKVISVNILYFDLGHGEDYVYHGTTSFRGLHKQDILQLSEEQRLLYEKNELCRIFPEYYLIKVNSFDDVAKDSLDEWIYFLKNEEIKEDFKARGLLKAKIALDILKLPERERAAYACYQDDLHYQASMVHSSYGVGVLKGVERGIKQGIEQGIKQGIERGAAQGRTEGERRKALEIARNLLDVMDNQTIAMKIGLTAEEIEDIRKV